MKETRNASAPATKGSLARLGEIMNTKVVTIEPKEAADMAWSRMQRRSVRHLVVTENGRLRGVVSERDLGGRSDTDIRKGRTVQDLMTARVVSAESKTTLHQAANLMGGRRIGCLPVLDRGRLVGIVTATDVFDELSRRGPRAPLPGWVPRALKRQSGRTAAPSVPLTFGYWEPISPKTNGYLCGKSSV